MPITEVTQYRTTNGSVYSSLELAKDAEAFEQIVEPILQHIVWRDEEFYHGAFINFLKTDAEAVAFVDALLDVYSHNPHILKENNDELAT